MKLFFTIFIGWIVCVPLGAEEQKSSDPQVTAQHIQRQKEKLQRSMGALFNFSRPSFQKMLLLLEIKEYKRLSLLVHTFVNDTQDLILDLQQKMAEEKYFLKRKKRKNVGYEE